MNITILIIDLTIDYLNILLVCCWWQHTCSCIITQFYRIITTSTWSFWVKSKTELSCQTHQSRQDTCFSRTRYTKEINIGITILTVRVLKLRNRKLSLLILKPWIFLDMAITSICQDITVIHQILHGKSIRTDISIHHVSIIPEWKTFHIRQEISFHILDLLLCFFSVFRIRMHLDVVHIIQDGISILGINPISTS